MIGDVRILEIRQFSADISYFLAKIKICCVAVFPPQDARDDVGGAQNAGMLGILVRTGKKLVYKWRHLSREPSHLHMCSSNWTH